MNEELARDRKFTVTQSTPSQCVRVLTIEVPEEEMEREREAVARQLRRDLRVPGFRRGKVPMAYVEKNYGDVIQGDAVRNLLPAVYEEAVVREGLRPITEPRFEKLKAERGEGMRVEARVEIRPDVRITGYDSVRIQVPRRPVGDAQVDEALQGLREGMATYVAVDRPSVSTDYMIIDYAPKLESGEIDAKAWQRGYPVDLTGGSLLEEFRSGLVGTTAGQSLDIRVHYPSDFAEASLAGKERSFHVEVKEVKEKLLPELDDNFASRVAEGVSSVEELRARVREDLEHREAHRFTHEVEERVIDQLIASNPFEVPRVMVDNYLASLVEEDRQRRRRPDDPDRDQEIRRAFEETAVRAVKRYFVLEAVRKQEAIAATDEELAERIASLAASTGQPVADLEAYFRHPERRRNLESEIVDRKVLNVLRERADIQ
jgi:trigger factor